MRIGRPKVVLNPYEWLPSFGETRIELRRGDGLNLNLDVFYESDGNPLEKKTIVFKNAWSFFFGAAPWVQLTGFIYEDVDARRKMLRSVIEYELSEAAHKLQGHLPPKMELLKHFEIYFLSANETLCVFAESCCLAAEE